MKQNSQFSDVLHVLLHMAEGDGPATSDMLAAALQTNPVVLRRLMSGLRDAGLVTSAKGHGGGWVLSCELDRTTLRDVHEDRKSTRLNSSHSQISYAVFCLKKKKQT